MIEEVDVEMEKEKVLLMWRTMVRFGTKTKSNQKLRILQDGAAL